MAREEAAELGPLADDLLRLFAQDDIEQAAATLPNKSAAGLLLIEQTWAIGLRDAIKQVGGVPIAGGLVAPEVLQELEEGLEMAKQHA